MTAFLSTLRKLRASDTIAFLAVATAIISAVMAGYTFFTAPDTPENWPVSKRFAKIETDLAEGRKSVGAEIQSLKTDTFSLRSEIAQLSKLPDNVKVAVQIGKLDNSLSDVTTRLGKSEAIILENPSKALEMPFLRKDIDNLNRSMVQI